MEATDQSDELAKLKGFLSAQEGGMACLCGRRFGGDGVLEAALADRRDVIVCRSDRGEWSLRCEHRSDELLRLLPGIGEVKVDEWSAFLDCWQRTMPRDAVFVIDALPDLLDKAPYLADVLRTASGLLGPTGQKIVACGSSADEMRRLVRSGGLLFGCCLEIARSDAFAPVWFDAPGDEAQARPRSAPARLVDALCRHPLFTVGVFVTALLWLFRFPDLNPEVWDDVAAAAGLRPPPNVLGGLVRGICLPLFRCFAPETAVFLIRLGGWLSGGLVAMLIYTVMRRFCGGWIENLSRTCRGRLVSFAALGSATVAFVCCEPVWNACQSLSATGLQLLLALGGVRALLLFADVKRRRYAYLATVLFTLLAGDMPFGHLGVLAVAAVVFRVNRSGGGDAASLKLANPLVRMTMRRVLTFVFLIGIFLVVLAECGWLRTLGGYADIVGTGLPSEGLLAYFSDCPSFFLRAASWQAWLLIAVVIVGPFVAARLFRDRAIDEEDFLPVFTIVAYSLIGVLAWTQLCGFRPFWFVNWFGGCVLRNPMLAAFVAFLSAQMLVWTLLVLGAAAFLKDPWRVAAYRHADEAATVDGGRTLALMNRIRRLAGPVAATVPLLVLLSVVPFRVGGTLHGMLAVIGDYLAVTVEESAGAARIFTDWYLDAGLEFEAFRRGGKLRTVALMGGKGERDLALRNRGVSDAEELKSSEVSAFNLLRTLVNEAPDGMTNSVVQLGFGLWRGKFGQPIYLGTLAVPPENPARPDVAACAARARALEERIVALYENGDPDGEVSVTIRDAFRFVQWRLARLGTMRAVVARSDGRLEEAEEEQRLVDRLNALNRSYAEMYRLQGREAEGRGAVLTPREGLRLGLSRADFKLARTFADSIVVGSPNDAEANFAIGMDYFLDNDYFRAEAYLQKCHAVRPDDPAVMNNLAVIMLRTRRLKEAEAFARKALEKVPGSVQLKSTLDSVLRAKRAQADRNTAL